MVTRVNKGDIFTLELTDSVIESLGIRDATKVYVASQTFHTPLMGLPPHSIIRHLTENNMISAVQFPKHVDYTLDLFGR